MRVILFGDAFFPEKKPPEGTYQGYQNGVVLPKLVFRCPKSQNVVWKPTGLTKRFLHVQNPKMSFGNLQGLTKRFLHTQNPKMSFGNLQTRTNSFFKQLCFMGPRPLGPIGPIFFYSIYLFIYFNIYCYVIELPIVLPIELPIELPIVLPIVLPL